MKVTDLMVERAAPWTQGSRHVARAALEAALAPLPEPNDDYKGVWLDYKGVWLAAIEMLRRERAKLAKVRAVVDAWNRPSSRQDSKAGVEVLLVQLLAILDRKENV